jgi:NAD(P)-dependent dehydrogenase (short-subunit alcohol dehydrogenase family)
VLADKVCLVTGGADGIGRATALEMARRGAAAVVVCDIQDEAGEDVCASIRQTGAEGVYVHCDVSDPAQVRATVDEAVRRFGGLDVLHNNVGVHESSFTASLTVDDLPLAAWERVYEINLRSVWLFTQHAAPHLRRSRRGPAIVNAGSTGGLTGYPMMNAYGATKAGVIQLTRTSAVDLAPHVRVNCYCPASVDTRMVRTYIDSAPDPDAALRGTVQTHLIPRLGRPEEIAAIVCFLSSEEAAWITGSVFTIDGGSLAWRGVGE